MPPCPREYRCGSRSARRDVPARRQQRNRRRRPPSTAMSDQAGVARFHQSRARGSGLRGPTRETREFREQVWPRLAAQTRFARAAGTARSLAATLFVCKHQRWKQESAAARLRGPQTCAFAHRQSRSGWRRHACSHTNAATGPPWLRQASPSHARCLDVAAAFVVQGSFSYGTADAAPDKRKPGRGLDCDWIGRALGRRCARPLRRLWDDRS